MSTASNLTIKSFPRIARRRADGIDWASIAQEFQVSVDELRDFLEENEPEWQQALARARANALDDTLDEALAVVRKALKSEDVKVQLAAAQRIATLVKLARQPAPGAGEEPGDFGGKLHHSIPGADKVATILKEKILKELEPVDRAAKSQPRPAAPAPDRMKV